MSNIKPEESFFALLGKAIFFIFNDIYAVCIGVITSFIGYLLPIRNIVHLIILFFFADVVFGYWAAKKLRKERFSVKIIWSHTIPRMVVSIVLITGCYMWDQVYAQDIVSTYKVIGWFISGVLLFSIAENGYQITKWSVFPKLGSLLSEKIKAGTGLEIDNDKKE